MSRRNLRRLFSECLESRRPLAADLAALDVNDDMAISPVDALMVINEINQASSSASTAEAEAGVVYDTNSDGVVSPQDVLLIVNSINSGITAVPAIESAVQQIAVPDNGTSDQPIDDTPTSDTPTDDTPTDDTPDDTPVDDTPTTDQPEDETDDSDETPDDSDSTDDDSTETGDDTSEDDTSGDDTSEEEPSEDDTTDDDTTDDGDSTTDDPADTDEHCEHDAAGERELIHGLVGRLRQGRGLFETLDANDDGSLTSDELPEALWTKLVEADVNEDGGVTQTELDDYREAQRLAAVEAFFNQLDRDDSGSLTSSDLPRVAWRLVSRADADDNGEVSLEEFITASVRHH